MVLVDDGAEALTGAAGEAMDAAVAMSRSGHTFVAVTAAPQYSNATREWLKTLRAPENVLLLRATSRTDMQLFGLGATGPDVSPAPRPGRGLLFLDGEPRRVQVAAGA